MQSIYAKIERAALKMDNIMLGKTDENKLSQVPFSNDTISSIINDMRDYTFYKTDADLILRRAKFSLWFDENTSVSNLSQLVVFVDYVKMT